MRIRDVDPETRRFVSGCLLSVVLGIVLWTAIALLVMSVAHGQTLVQIDRSDYSAGHERVECWLTPIPAAAQYVAGTLLVTCGSDPDGLFRNGFELTP